MRDVCGRAARAPSKDGFDPKNRMGVSQVKRVQQYIAEQEKHHAAYSFEDEFKGLLRKNEIEFDLAYLWI